MFKFINNISYKTHLFIGLVVRLIVIIFGAWIDEISEVPFTDIDYRVVTDGARHILANRSPFARHTFRYSPLLAFSLLPNILLHDCFGKILFSICDIIVAALIHSIVKRQYETIWHGNVAVVAERRNIKDKKQLQLPRKYCDYAKWAALTWLYNPLGIAISTRGNGDSITATLILFTLYLLQTGNGNSFRFLMAGLIHGLAIHFRLYPLVFSLAYYFYAANDHRGNIFKTLFLPNRKQLSLVVGTVTSLAGVTYSFFQWYGYQFLYETYIYHIIRKDTRHNFSLYFYMQYLSASEVISSIEKILTFMPQLVILILSAVHFGRHSKTLPFCIFIQSFTLVTFNPVITSQYFIWFLSVLPLCWHNLTNIGVRTGMAYTMLWFLAQGAWLGPAYMLEFKGWNMFGLIWMQGVMFFCVNMFLLQRIIFNFNVIADFRLKQF